MKIDIKNVTEIKQAVTDGKTVFCGTDSYVVIKSNENYLIKFLFSEYCIFLHGVDENQLNGNDFYYYE